MWYCQYAEQMFLTLVWILVLYQVMEVLITPQAHCHYCHYLAIHAEGRRFQHILQRLQLQFEHNAFSSFRFFTDFLALSVWRYVSHCDIITLIVLNVSLLIKNQLSLHNIVKTPSAQDFMHTVGGIIIGEEPLLVNMLVVVIQ